MAESIGAELLWSFVVGAASVSTLTLTADKFGSKLAGALGGFPSTIAASLFFLGLTEGPEAASKAASVIPLLMGFFGVLLASYAALVSRGLLVALGTSLGVWFALSFLSISFGQPPLALTLTLFLLLLIGSYYVTEIRMHIPSRPGGKVDLSLRQMLIRILCGGSVVALPVFIGSKGGLLVAGVMAAFPAVTVSTLIATYQSGGPELSAAISKTMMLSGMVNVTTYVVTAHLLYPLLGVVEGTIVAAAMTCCSGFATFVFVRKKMQ